MQPNKDFIPAAHYDFLTPFYGFFMEIFFGGAFKKITNHIKLGPNGKLLDVGCGPANLLRVIHKKYPENKLIGLDIDPKILKIAHKKLSGKAQLIQSSATELPFADNSADVVTSTLMIHHLDTLDKEKMIKEIYRVLKPGGRFFLFDFAKPVNLFGKIFVFLFHKFEHMEDALNNKYAEWTRKAGFKKTGSLYSAYGMIELTEAVK